MRKQLLIAAVAATMSVAATADISITGDAYINFAKQKIGAADTANTNHDSQRTRLKLVGSAGDAKVTAIVRNDGATRADDNDIDNSKKGLHMDSLYLTTKVGPVNVKVGDYWGTIGLGARSLDAARSNALSASTKVGDWKLGLFTADGSSDDGSDTTNVSASGLLGPVSVGLVHNPGGFTNFTAKTTFNGILFAVDKWNDKRRNIIHNDTTLIHIGGKVNHFTWDLAQIKNDQASDMTDTSIVTNGKFAPLGSMLIGRSARGGTATAVADVSHFSEILGVAVSTKLAGNTVKAIYTKNTMFGDDKVTGTELIVSRPLGGTTLTANIAKLSDVNTIVNGNATNTGLRLDVKF